jgi:uncharacterized glyoxalase superfamily protein PhnB
MLTGHATVLLVGNVQRAADYYRDRLGFTVSTYEADPALYGSAERDNCHVRFAHYDGAGGRRNSDVVPPDMFDAYFWPDDDVDALHAELEGRGATIIQPPTDQPYGLREFRVQDPDGHILAFGNRNT